MKVPRVSQSNDKTLDHKTTCDRGLLVRIEKLPPVGAAGLREAKENVRFQETPVNECGNGSEDGLQAVVDAWSKLTPEARNLVTTIATSTLLRIE